MSRIILIFLIAAPFIPCFCYGDTLTVDDDGPADYTTIQDAINAALDGDTVEVAEGHYYENIDFRGKAITVTSTDPCDPCTVADTIIDANGDGIVVSFHSDEGPDSVITGFTITGGYAQYGPGICCWAGASPTISHCLITSNNPEHCSESQGGGIYCDEGSPVISYCTISSNSAAYGGGIYCTDTGYTIIADSTISKNTASYFGGGIYCADTVTNCIISHNTTYQYSGGGIYGAKNVKNCTITCNSAGWHGAGVHVSTNVENCTIRRNTANREGGGICYGTNVSNCAITGNIARNGGGVYSARNVRNCVISGNQAVASAGAVYCESGETISHCTIIGNLAEQYGSGIYCYDAPSPPIITNNMICNSPSGCGIYAMYSEPTISYNNVYGNSDGDYGGWAWPGEGDISVDPCFVDPGHWEDPCNTPGDLTDDVWVDGDYHLMYESLCINAGDPCFVVDPCEVDMDGESRVRLGRVDIGADEAGSNLADFDESGLVDLSDFDVLSAAWLTVPEDTGWNRACDISESADDVIDLLDFSVYSEQWLWQAQWHIP